MGCHIVVGDKENLIVVASLNHVNGKACRTITSPPQHTVALLVIRFKIKAEKAANVCRSMVEINVSFNTDPKYPCSFTTLFHANFNGWANKGHPATLAHLRFLYHLPDGFIPISAA